MHGGHHAAIQEVSGLMNARRVNQNNLTTGARDEALNLVARRLRLVRHGSNLLAYKTIQERGLSSIGSSDERDITAAVRLGLRIIIHRSKLKCALVYTARLRKDEGVRMKKKPDFHSPSFHPLLLIL